MIEGRPCNISKACIIKEDNSACGSANSSRVAFIAAQGQMYTIVVTGHASLTGSYTLAVLNYGRMISLFCFFLFWLLFYLFIYCRFSNSPLLKAPRINDIQPTIGSGIGGTSLTIRGENFVSAGYSFLLFFSLKYVIYISYPLLIAGLISARPTSKIEF